VDELEYYFYKEKGWEHPGYHIVVDKDGHRYDLLAPEYIANGARGFNSDSLHISYMGGVDKHMNPQDTRTQAQKDTLYELVKNFKHTLQVPTLGHRDLPDVEKACPSFEVSKWLKEVGL
jgi:N-acetylmuramoyl-L-alanine amidase